MSQEHHHERIEHSEEDKAQLEHARLERLEELKHNSEQLHDDAAERADAAREKIHKPEPKMEHPAAEEHTPHHEPHQPLHHNLDYKLNYTQTMASMRRHLRPASRTFSRLIHTPAIEKASEAMESTIARPSLTAGATWTALIVGSIFYFTARHFGYVLSGSEIDLSFIVGAIIGLALESAWRTLFRR